jgi:hypothetical protein
MHVGHAHNDTVRLSRVKCQVLQAINRFEAVPAGSRSTPPAARRSPRAPTADSDDAPAIRGLGAVPGRQPIHTPGCPPFAARTDRE